MEGVEDPRPTVVKVTPEVVQLTALEATQPLNAQVFDQYGETMSGVAVTWTSDGGAVATVDQSGLVSAVGNGHATITATAEPASGTATVTVNQLASAVTVSPGVDSMRVGDEPLQLTAEATDANGHVIQEAGFSWESGDTLVAVVDDSGLVTARGSGLVEITATSSGVSGSASLSVSDSVIIVRFVSSSESAPEPGRVVLELALSGASSHPTVLQYIPGTDDDPDTHDADASDYSHNGSGTISIPAGATSYTFAFDITDDGEIEPTREVFTVTLQPPAEGTGLVLESPSTATVTILEGVCDRTPVVRDALIAHVRASDCIQTDAEDLRRVVELVINGGAGFGEGDVAWTPDLVERVRRGECEGGTSRTGPENSLLSHAGGTDCLRTVVQTEGEPNRHRYALDSGYGTTTLRVGDFSELPEMKQLYLWRLQLAELQPGLFADLGLDWLSFQFNRLTTLPADIFSDMKYIRHALVLANNHISSLPEEVFTDLNDLRWLILDRNRLTDLPANLSRDLPKLQWLVLSRNSLSQLPPDLFSNLSRLEVLWLHQNQLGGSIPPELGRLSSLQVLYLFGNQLTGTLPVELGDMHSLRYLGLDDNDLTGEIPVTFGNLYNLQSLVLTDNPGMAGPIPVGLTNANIQELMLGDTQLCVPDDPAFDKWLPTVLRQRVRRCTLGPPLYLTQAVQSLRHPVPLVAGDSALLRVFVTADSATDAMMPPARATFYRDNSVVHVADIPGGQATIPTTVKENALSQSLNAEIPGSVVQPGLEVVVDIDPIGTLDPSLGVPTRIPAVGRASLDVRVAPLLPLTVVPLLAGANPDSSILTLTEGLDAEDPLFWETRTLLPVREFDVVVHEPVTSATNNIFVLLNEVDMIRVMEGQPGYYMGLVTNPEGAGGVARVTGRTSIALPEGHVMAHELGHNFSLLHAPCGNPAGLDPSYPYNNGAIGAWGYDFRSGGRLVARSTKDMMSYCTPAWIGEFNFGNAFRFRVWRDGVGTVIGEPVTTILLWGGLDDTGTPYLEPSFVVNAPPVLPDSGGEYELRGRGPRGEELFAFTFDMLESGHGGPPSFVFALPIRPQWAGELARITLAGATGSVTMEERSGRAVTVLRDSRTGRVLRILRDEQQVPESGRAAGIEALFSMGIPEAKAWMR